MFASKKTQHFTIVFLAAVSTAYPLGDLAESRDKLKNFTRPHFFALEEGQESLAGVIIDGATTTNLKDISLFGRTEIDGICREDNDSITSINLNHVAQLLIVDQNYKSTRYAKQGKADHFCLVKKIAHDGTVTEGLLMPRKIIVSGIEQPSGDQKSWFISHCDALKITIVDGHSHPAQQQQAAPIQQHHKKVVAETVTPYADKTVKVVENVGSGGVQKTFNQAISDVLAALISLIKVVFGFLRNLFW